MKKVTIIGAGALGSHLVMLLRNEAELKVVDFDSVEQKNTLSQFHGKTNVRKNKTQSLQQTMQFLFGVKVQGIPHKLHKDNQEALLGGTDLIIDCVDNAQTRHLIQGYAYKTGIPCLHGAMAADGTFGRVVWTENFVVDSEDVVGAPTCENGDHLPFISVVSAHLAKSAQVFLKTGKKISMNIHPTGLMSF